MMEPFGDASPESHMNARQFQHRDIDFHMAADIPVHWLGGDCHLTRFYDAMSIMFPEGERAFIESVQIVRDRIDDEVLKSSVKEFVAQEALHTREHIRYNHRLAQQGAPVSRLERRVARQQAFARRYFPASVRLAITACLEHFTAMFADSIMRDPRNMAGAHPDMIDFWLWHALEETEHKSVAFDVLTTVIRSPVRRYLLRCAAMLFVTPTFSALLWQMTFALIRHDGHTFDMRGWWRLLWTQFARPGLFTRMIPSWLAWFLPRFHPWQHDNSELIERYAQRFNLKQRVS